LAEGTVLDGASAADGFAVGRAMRLTGRESSPDSPGPVVALHDAIVRVRRDLRHLLALLAPDEAELFEPELHILDEIAPKLIAREAEGESCEEAIFTETDCGCTDLVIDLRERLLGAVRGSSETNGRTPAMHDESDLVLLTEVVTPSTVAFLPKQVVAIVAPLEDPTRQRRDGGRNSHAAILARGRGVPVVYVTPDLLSSIHGGARLVVDATEAGARIWVGPSEALLEDARRRLQVDEGNREGAARESLDHLGLALRVNVGSAHDEIPAAADGVGLVRTEITFLGSVGIPKEDDQLAALLRIAAKARGAPVVVRLWDAGADKPLPWLGGKTGSTRGIARLLAYPKVLATQLAALARARARADIRVLLPFVQTADEVNAVRSRASPDLPIGAMVESPEAVDAIEAIASAADFVCVGTNDLTATALGVERTADVPIAEPRLLSLLHRAIVGARAVGREATICGELAGGERGARLSVGLGANAISVSPARVAIVRSALARATLEACRAEALAALGHGW
jgi:phosphoenolpyruvate-protein kinase (PTS system EI component)